MRSRLTSPSPALVISIVALFVALGGTTYAATSLPANSVGTVQLKNGAVTNVKLAPGLTLPSGRTERGVWSVMGQAGNAGPFLGTAVTFPVPLAAAIAGGKAVFVPVGTSSLPGCPGAGRADAGYLCVYEHGSNNRVFQAIDDPTSSAFDGASRYGFEIFFYFNASGGGFTDGSWAVTAP